MRVYRPDIGGGIGRRGGTQDYVHQAVAIAKNFPDVPVKMIWSREEDMTHDFYRPISQCKLSAGLDDNGNLVGLHARISGQSINAYLNPALITGGKDDFDTYHCDGLRKTGAPRAAEDRFDAQSTDADACRHRPS
jgi:isoquinoline 1-oxidoreductase subunit beta